MHTETTRPAGTVLVSANVGAIGVLYPCAIRALASVAPPAARTRIDREAPGAATGVTQALTDPNPALVSSPPAQTCSPGRKVAAGPEGGTSSGNAVQRSLPAAIGRASCR